MTDMEFALMLIAMFATLIGWTFLYNWWMWKLD